MRHFARGYTLIEILIALTIMSLVFGIGFSGFRDYSRRQTLESLARQVRGDISIAKERALAGTKPASPNAQCDSPHSLRGHGILLLQAELLINFMQFAPTEPVLLIQEPCQPDLQL